MPVEAQPDVRSKLCLRSRTRKGQQFGRRSTSPRKNVERQTRPSEPSSSVSASGCFRRLTKTGPVYGIEITPLKMLGGRSNSFSSSVELSLLADLAVTVLPEDLLFADYQIIGSGEFQSSV